MLDFSENGTIEFTAEDLGLIAQLERDERIIKAVQKILEQRRNKV